VVTVRTFVAVAGFAIAAGAACRGGTRAAATDGDAPVAVVAGVVHFGWPVPATAVVEERVTRPADIAASVTYDLTVSAAGDRLAVDATGFRDGVYDGRPRRPDQLGLTFVQPLLQSAIARDRLHLEVTAAGALVGAATHADALAHIDHLAGQAPTPELAGFAAQARALVDTPEVAAGVAAGAADLWIPWVGLWLELGALPAVGAERTATAFGLPVTVRTVGAGAAPGTIHVTAHTRRAATTDTDLSGPRTWFVPSGGPSPIDLETTFELTVDATLDPATLQPHHVTLDVTEIMQDRPGPPRRWRFDYSFRW
jgi:hypothetical protein